MIVRKKKKIPAQHVAKEILEMYSVIMDLEGIGLFLEYEEEKEEQMTITQNDLSNLEDRLTKVIVEAITASEKRMNEKNNERFDALEKKNDERFDALEKKNDERFNALEKKNDERWAKQEQFNKEQKQFNKKIIERIDNLVVKNNLME